MDSEEQEKKIRIPVITVVLVAVNVIVFIITECSGSSLDSDHMMRMGAMYEPAFWDDQQYYRIFTCMFLHFGGEHLINNMISLFVLGYALEHGMGKGLFTAVYFVSGIVSGMASLWYHTSTGQEVVSCGASGAIYGLMGALLVFLVAYRRQHLREEAPRFLLYLALSFLAGFQDPGIDGAAHLGGFIGGFLLCIIVCVIKRFFWIERGR